MCQTTFNLLDAEANEVKFSKRFSPALGVVQMFDSDGDPLGKDSALDALVHDDTDGVLGHIEDAASLAVVRLVGHTLLEGAVTLRTKIYFEWTIPC